jgi:hypothetical protein
MQPGNTSLFFPAKTKVNCDWGNNTCQIVVSNCVGCVTRVFFGSETASEVKQIIKSYGLI